MADKDPRLVYDEPMIKIKASVRKDDRALFRQIGGGNMSRGVRKAADAYRTLRDQTDVKVE